MFVAVDMQDALLLVVEVNAFVRSPRKEMLSRRDGQASSVNRVSHVVGDVGDELRKPGQLVPAGFGIDEERDVPA